MVLLMGVEVHEAVQFVDIIKPEKLTENEGTYGVKLFGQSLRSSSYPYFAFLLRPPSSHTSHSLSRSLIDPPP